MSKNSYVQEHRISFLQSCRNLEVFFCLLPFFPYFVSLLFFQDNLYIQFVHKIILFLPLNICLIILQFISKQQKLQIFDKLDPRNSMKIPIKWHISSGSKFLFEFSINSSRIQNQINWLYALHFTQILMSYEYN